VEAFRRGVMVIPDPVSVVLKLALGELAKAVEGIMNRVIQACVCCVCLTAGLLLIDSVAIIHTAKIKMGWGFFPLEGI